MSKKNFTSEAIQREDIALHVELLFNHVKVVVIIEFANVRSNTIERFFITVLYVYEHRIPNRDSSHNSSKMKRFPVVCSFMGTSYQRK